jgi:hypothetical protein
MRVVPGGLREGGGVGFGVGKAAVNELGLGADLGEGGGVATVLGLGIGLCIATEKFWSLRAFLALS